MRPHAKLFLLNNPVNPTAQLYDAQEVEELFEIRARLESYAAERAATRLTAALRRTCLSPRRARRLKRG